MASPGTDIAFSEARTEGYRAFANKIWNAARFLFMNIDRAKERTGLRFQSFNPGVRGELDGTEPLETRWIASRLHRTTEAVNRALDNYRFDEAASSIYQFFWVDFCDWYLEIVKKQLNFEEGENNNRSLDVLQVFFTVFESTLRLLSPFMPFITEEIWHALYHKLELSLPAKSIALTRYPQSADFPFDPQVEPRMGLLQTLIETIRAERKERGVPEKEPVGVYIIPSNQAVSLALSESGNLFQDTEYIICSMVKVSAIEYKEFADLEGSLRALHWRFAGGAEIALLYERQIDIPAERERLTKDLAKYEKGLTAAERQLGNEAFMAKAPAHIVDGLRKQAAETKILYDKTKSALDALGL
ncbi:MAG TPA: class I tRNA ligase family protein, partial [Edaphobacter sp.]|nr:class I tRNA ligase family protein [Edaphobacter sp.]